MDSLHIDPLALVLWFVAFILSTTCHEAAHALVAKLGGDKTAYETGQVSLNPLPHIRREPFGMVVVPLLSFLWAGWMIGWASAPYDPYWADRHPRRAALMAAAGPAANLLLALLAITLIWWLVAAGVAVPPETASITRLVDPVDDDQLYSPLIRLLGVLAVLNALLGAFNLLPLPPLDGASVLSGLGGDGMRRVFDMMRTSPMAGIIGLLVAWRLFGMIAGPVFRLVLDLAYPGIYA